MKWKRRKIFSVPSITLVLFSGKNERKDGDTMAFNKKQQQDISSKIQILRAEGYGEEQSIAIALDMFRRGTLPAAVVKKSRAQQRFRRKLLARRRKKK
tara:strand:- start:149 stop:442 length:294 start_codon:yes stop_codon:yes gene_type:complete